jgi:hypothetical protein
MSFSREGLALLRLRAGAGFAAGEREPLVMACVVSGLVLMMTARRAPLPPGRSVLSTVWLHGVLDAFFRYTWTGTTQTLRSMQRQFNPAHVTWR